MTFLRTLLLSTCVAFIAVTATADDVPAKPGVPIEAPDDFSGPAPDYLPNSLEEIQRRIEKQVEMVCKNGLCEIASVNTRGDNFTTEFFVGYGDPNGYNYNSGGVIIVGDDQSRQDDKTEPYVGLKLKYQKYNCTQTVNVPESIYRSMNTYLSTLLDEEGNPKKNFDPAHQTMILFYTTMMNLAKGCGGSAQGVQ